MTQDGESLWRLRGIDSGLERYTVRGGQVESFAHGRTLRSQMPNATSITTARTAVAISNQRVCMASEGTGPRH